MSLIRKHEAVLQAWACLDLVISANTRLLRTMQSTICFHSSDILVFKITHTIR